MNIIEDKEKVIYKNEINGKVSYAIGLVIPTIEEQKEKTELLMKLNQLDLDIDEIKEKYEIDDLRDLSIEQLKNIVGEE